MFKRGLWTENDEQLLEDLPKIIDDLKVDLYQTQFKSDTRRVVRKDLIQRKSQFQTLFEKRHKYDMHGATYTALMSKSKYLIGTSLYWENGLPVFTEDAFWKNDSRLLQLAIDKYNDNKISEPTFRMLARTEPWKTTFHVSKKENSVFGKPSVDLSDDQKTLLAWSMLYDNIQEHPECPSSKIIDDDDMLDGWLILQRRNKNSNKTAFAEDNDKISQSQEIYKVAETPEDAAEIYGLNDEYGKMMLKARNKLIKEREVVNELEMPDTQIRLMNAMAELRSKNRG